MKRLLIAAVKIYRKTISPLTPGTCRFIPTCSEYAMEALEKRGVLVGLGLTLWRLLRCNPFNKHCGYDPVPEKKNK